MGPFFRCSKSRSDAVFESKYPSLILLDIVLAQIQARRECVRSSYTPTRIFSWKWASLLLVVGSSQHVFRSGNVRGRRTSSRPCCAVSAQRFSSENS